MSDRIPWETGKLWPRVKAQSAYGLSTGDLQPIETESTTVASGGITFLVRILANLTRKENARKQQGKTKPANPFLPYEPNLYVSDITDTHLCLLNKFKVVDHHFLIVTRQFEPQENWLTLADFQALALCLSEIDGLAFFNGGPEAGASQPHKHLQIVPYSNSLLAFPIEELITLAQHGRPLPLPFRHAIKHLSRTAEPEKLLTTYHQLLSMLSITGPYQGTQTTPYNLLCTRRWMMIVPRIQEKYANISVNSLGFAGSLLVKNQESLSELKAIGPMELLKKVSIAAE
ncbi:MAG: DUF4922 domain-containing protein [Cyanobacteria bacterium P01_D01_bin.105]